MRNHYFYFAVFEPAEEGGFTVVFPDLPGCITEGDTIEETIDMAKDALSLHLWNMEDDGDIIPEPTLPGAFYMSEYEKGSFVTCIRVYMVSYREKMENKATSKNVTLPYWLKKAAEENGINFSQVLQTAIKQELGIIER